MWQWFSCGLSIIELLLLNGQQKETEKTNHLTDTCYVGKSDSRLQIKISVSFAFWIVPQ